MNRRGNVLFLILIAVALFAALSYAVTQSSAPTGNNAKSEQMKLAASEMLQYFSLLDFSISRMKISKNIQEENIDFRHGALGKDGVTPRLSHMNNPNCASASCELFNPDGGNVTVKNFEKYTENDPSLSPGNLHPGHIILTTIDWPCMGTSANDVALLYWAMEESICNAINEELGITAMPETSSHHIPSSQDSANWDVSALTVTSNSNQICGKKTFANVRTVYGQPDCFVYHALFAR
jgi:hypothetical protein